MMTNFWHIGDNWINPAHIIRIARVESRVQYNALSGNYEGVAIPLELHIYISERTESGQQEYTTVSNYIVVEGQQAERLAAWLDVAADFPADEPIGEGGKP